MPNLIISNTSIRQDLEGRYCLNDLHEAAGKDKKHQPANFLRLDNTKELQAEIDRSSDLRNVNSIQGGRKQGTYVAKELVYAYAMWISPAFSLKVIRAYDNQTTSQPQNALPQALQLESFHLIEDSLQQLLYENFQNLVDIRVLLYIKDGKTHFTQHLSKTERVMDAQDFVHFSGLNSNLHTKYDLEEAAFIGISATRVYMHIKHNQPKLVKQLSASELVIDTVDLMPIFETASILKEKYDLSLDSFFQLEV